jgi:hypothetical protein
MSKHEHKQSGSVNIFAVALAAIAICAAAVLLMPAHANPEASSGAYAGPSGYFPDQFVNQAKEIEPMPEIFY